MSFEQVFAFAQESDYQGLNITLPYKELAVARVQIEDPLVRAMAAVNTVVFTDAGAEGYNTDHSGFIAAYRAVRGDSPPGRVALIGAGGVGKAIAFGLLALGVQELHIADWARQKADSLATALRAASSSLQVQVHDEAIPAAQGATGLINCTPVGMVGYGGTPLGKCYMEPASWAFDAVYTPIDTPFLLDAQAADLQTISGYELFFYQGVDAFEIFSGCQLQQDRLRQQLCSSAEPALAKPHRTVNRPLTR